jgi:hypothetical protein
METLKPFLYFWNDWIVGVGFIALGAYFWFRTKTPYALLIGFGVLLLFISTVIEAVFRGNSGQDLMSFYYRGAAIGVGLAGFLLCSFGGIWYFVIYLKQKKSNTALNSDARPSAPHAD